MTRTPGLAALVLVLATCAGCGGGDGPAPPTSSRTQTHPFGPTPSDAPEPRRGAPVVAALGDSITAGTPLWNPDPDVRERNPDSLNPQSQYEYWAQARLGGRLRFRNCGVSGETTAQIGRRLARCVRGASVVVVQGGINDVARGGDLDRAVAELERTVRRAKRAGIAVLLADVLPWNRGPPRAAARIDRLNRAIRAIGREQAVPILNFHRALEDPRAPGRMRADLTLEGDHPSVIGYRALGELVARAAPIRRLAFEQGPRG